MKSIFVSITLVLLLTACAIPESEQLRKDNSDLKSQLEVVTQERDALKSQIDSIRKALEAPSLTPDPNATDPTPDPGTPDPAAPDPKPEAATPENPADPSLDEPNVAPEAPMVPEKPVTPEITPQSNLPIAPAPNAGASVTTSPLYKYATAVLQSATDYRVRTQQNPPSECSLGYSAGETVDRSSQVKRCEVQALENNQYRVRVEGIDGSVVIVP